jgi:hypothetical protein
MKMSSLTRWFWQWHATSRRLFPLIALGLMPTCSGQQPAPATPQGLPKTYVDTDAYSIYAVLLEGTKHSSFVIQSETESWSGTTLRNVGIKGDRKFRKVWGAALNDFVKQYRTPKLLTKDIPIAVPYQLLSGEKLPGWNSFHQLYPLVDGYYWFSAVGFDRQRNHAIVDMNYSCGPLRAHGEPHFLEKKNGTWREVSINAEVTVWAS